VFDFSEIGGDIHNLYPRKNKCKNNKIMEFERQHGILHNKVCSGKKEERLEVKRETSGSRGTKRLRI
jgi:hypothetical protein